MYPAAGAIRKKDMNFSKADKAMIRHAAAGLNGSEIANLENKVAARLQADLDAGVMRAVTKNHLRAAITGELSRGK
jgi:hypothetical protein